MRGEAHTQQEAFTLKGGQGRRPGRVARGAGTGLGGQRKRAQASRRVGGGRGCWWAQQRRGSLPPRPPSSPRPNVAPGQATARQLRARRDDNPAVPRRAARPGRPVCAAGCMRTHVRAHARGRPGGSLTAGSLRARPRTRPRAREPEWSSTCRPHGRPPARPLR